MAFNRKVFITNDEVGDSRELRPKNPEKGFKNLKIYHLYLQITWLSTGKFSQLMMKLATRVNYGLKFQKKDSEI